MNTKINYLYRDGGNYKVYNEAVISGVFTEEQKKTILDCLDCGEFFVPSAVGLPERTMEDYGFDYDTELDHPLFEKEDNFFEETADEPTVEITAEELVQAFVKHKDRWL